MLNYQSVPERIVQEEHSFVVKHKTRRETELGWKKDCVDYCKMVKNEGRDDFIPWDGFRKLTMNCKIFWKRSGVLGTVLWEQRIRVKVTWGWEGVAPDCLLARWEEFKRSDTERTSVYVPRIQKLRKPSIYSIALYTQITSSGKRWWPCGEGSSHTDFQSTELANLLICWSKWTQRSTNTHI